MIIQRYILKEVILTWVAVTFVLTLIYAIGLFIRFLSAAAAGSLQADVVFILIGLRFITSSTILIPISLYLSILLALGRLYKDSEMTALMACGVGINVAMGTIVKLSLLVFSILMVVSFYTAPWAERQLTKTKAYAEATADITAIASGRFKTVSKANLVFYAERIGENKKEMEKVFAQREDNGVTQLITANKAYQTNDKDTGERFIVFEDGYMYEGSPGRADFKVTKFHKNGVRIPRPKVSLNSWRKPARLSSELFKSDKISDKAIVQWRLALPLTTLFLSVLAVLLSRSDPRRGQFAKVFAAILIY